jgi:hypothetical protein
VILFFIKERKKFNGAKRGPRGMRKQKEEKASAAATRSEDRHRRQEPRLLARVITYLRTALCSGRACRHLLAPDSAIGLLPRR